MLACRVNGTVISLPVALSWSTVALRFWNIGAVSVKDPYVVDRLSVVCLQNLEGLRDSFALLTEYTVRPSLLVNEHVLAQPSSKKRKKKKAGRR